MTSPRSFRLFGKRPLGWSLLLLPALLLLWFYLRQEKNPELSHGHFWDALPVFYMLLGLLGCLFLAKAAKWCAAQFLYRNEDYYDL